MRLLRSYMHITPAVLLNNVLSWTAEMDYIIAISPSTAPTNDVSEAIARLKALVKLIKDSHTNKTSVVLINTINPNKFHFILVFYNHVIR